MVGLPDGFNTQCPVCTYLFNYYTTYDNNDSSKSIPINERLDDHLNRRGATDGTDTHRSLVGNYTSNDVYNDSIKLADKLYNDVFSNPSLNNNNSSDSTQL